MITIQGRLKNDKEIARALGRSPKTMQRYLRAWLIDERARFVGGKDSRGKRRKGYRNILENRRLRKRPGTWATQVTGLFKGYVNARRMQNMEMRAGVGLNNPRQIHKALWKLQEGGSITSSKYMPIPIYKNISKVGVTRGFWRGKVFKRMIQKGDIVGLQSGGDIYYFDKDFRRRRGAGFKRSGLLFIGTKRISVSKQFTGRYDFYGRFERMRPAMLNRARGVVDRATRKIERIG